jgi:electron transfer flavoprotein beta subunit
VLKDINMPRIPKLKNARKARTAEITVWRPDDIGADPEKIGLNASPTRVVKTEPPAVRSAVTMKLDGEPAGVAKALAKELSRRVIL